jgi:hypothetical protein
MGALKPSHREDDEGTEEEVGAGITEISLSTIF